MDISSYPYSGQVPPSRAWYVVAAGVLLVGLIAFVFFLFMKLSGLGEGYVRLVAPGSTEISLEEPGTYVIHHEHKSIVDGKIYSAAKGNGLEGMQVEIVLLPGEAPVALREATMSSTYSFGPYEGTSLMEFDVVRPGRFRVRAFREDGWETPRAVLSIGRESVGDILMAVFGGLAIIFGSILLSAGIFVWTLVRRNKVLKPVGQG